MVSATLSLDDVSGEILAACRLCGDVAEWQLPKIPAGPLISRCGSCGFSFASHPRRSTLDCDVQDHFGGIDEEKYFRSVMATRLRSYDTLLRRVKKHVSTGTWLDVGCSYGWLLKHVSEDGYRGEGIEPSTPAAKRATDQGLQVRTGLFPAALGNAERFDVISFMDVLEHFEHPAEALEATRIHLAPGGVAVIQVPDQACWLFRLAEAMHRVSGGRVSFALRRLWLDGFDFPHQFYFTRCSLSLLLNQTGFEVLDWQRTPIGHPAEALDRVAYAKDSGSRVSSLAVGLAVGLINAVDAACGHGGLLTMIARPR